MQNLIDRMQNLIDDPWIVIGAFIVGGLIYVVVNLLDDIVKSLGKIETLLAKEISSQTDDLLYALREIKSAIEDVEKEIRKLNQAR